MTAATLRSPEVAGIGRGLVFALIAHGLLILALSYGLHWRSDSEPAFEAELWSSIPQIAAPREEAPPEPEPEAPKPDLKAQQQRAEEEAAEQQREADIAIAKEKKRKEEKARDEAARLEREKAAKDKEAKEKADKAAKEKAEQDRKKDKTAKDAKEAKEAKDADARREALRQENLRRIQGMAGGTPGSTGAAAQNAAPSASWIGQVKGAILRNVIFNVGATNPVAEIRVFLTPDGKIIGMKMMHPSPDSEWNEAALRAIERTGSLPRDGAKSLPAYLDLPMRPQDVKDQR